MSDGADRDVIHTGQRVVAHALQCDSARHFDLDAFVRARGAHGAHPLQRVTHLSGCEVVEHDAIHADREQLFQELHGIHLDFHESVGTASGEMRNEGFRSAERAHVVVLYEHHGIERTPVILRAAATHRVLVELAPERNRLARVEYDNARPRHRIHETRGERGHAAHVLEEIERRALRGHDGCGTALDRAYRLPGRDAIALSLIHISEPTRLLSIS